MEEKIKCYNTTKFVIRFSWEPHDQIWNSYNCYQVQRFRGAKRGTHAIII
jgi:hypothetical protein